MVEWAKVPEYSYEVSDDGQVRRLPSRRPLKVAICPSLGRPIVRLCRDGRPRTFKVHSLMMLAFVGVKPPGMQVCHNNGDKVDNVLSNLRYDTPSANALDTIAHGGNTNVNKTHCPKNHEYDLQNTYVRKNGHRMCRACARERAL